MYVCKLGNNTQGQWVTVSKSSGRKPDDCCAKSPCCWQTCPPIHLSLGNNKLLRHLNIPSIFKYGDTRSSTIVTYNMSCCFTLTTVILLFCLQLTLWCHHDAALTFVYLNLNLWDFLSSSSSYSHEEKQTQTDSHWCERGQMCVFRGMKRVCVCNVCVTVKRLLMCLCWKGQSDSGYNRNSWRRNVIRSLRNTLNDRTGLLLLVWS